jgi:hypothetical protein
MVLLGNQFCGSCKLYSTCSLITRHFCSYLDLLPNFPHAMLNLNHVLKERNCVLKNSSYIRKQEESITDKPIKKNITGNKIHSSLFISSCCWERRIINKM